MCEIQACAIYPSLRRRQTLNMLNALKLGKGGSDNRWCKEFQVKVAEEGCEVMRVYPAQMPDV